MKARGREMIRWGKLLFERRLISGWGGNLSCRVGRNEFMITAQHAPLAFLTPKDLVRIDHQGKPLNQKQRPSSETPMHLAVYQGTDAEAIVHVHPPMTLVFSLTHKSFVPVSFEEKYTVGEVPVIAQDTPTVTQPEEVVRELKYHSLVILQGHGTVAIGKNFEEAFLFTDLLEEAVHCQFFKERISPSLTLGSGPGQTEKSVLSPLAGPALDLFSREHVKALADSANGDPQFRNHGNQTGLSTSLTLRMEEPEVCWTIRFVNGEITSVDQKQDGEFMISGKQEWWRAVFANHIDPFTATQQGKLVLERGALAQLSRWYKPFQRAFSLWQTIPIR
jgi:L-fuculose-phosphate aldolase